MFSDESSPSKTSQRVDRLYTGSNHVIFLTILGLFVPFLMVVFAILGLYYAWQKYRLPREFNADALQLTGDDENKIRILSRRPIRFVVPLFVVVLWAVAIATCFAMGLIDVQKLIEYLSR